MKSAPTPKRRRCAACSIRVGCHIKLMLPNKRWQRALDAEIAGYQAANGHLSALVDELRGLLARVMANFKTLHNAATPDDGPELSAIIPAAVFAKCVDEDVALRYAIKHSAHDGMLPVVQPA